MGYTHYFRHGNATNEAWDKIISDCKRLYENMPKHSTSSGACYSLEPLKIDDQDGGEPIFDNERILFNGAGYEDADHETFIINKINNDEFEFCKTARKPYDLMVQACLIVYHHHSPDTIDVGSDGDNDDWKAAKKFVRETLGYGSTLDFE